MKNSKNRGITLVALVVTIIILLILAGIAIASLTGSGLFAKSEEAKQRTIKAQLKEEIEIAIQEMQIEEIENGNILTLQIIADKLPLKLERLTARLEQIYIVGEYKGYEYTIDDKFKVEFSNEIQGISINYTLNNTDLYTNQDIILSISAQSTNGEIVSLSGPDDIVQNQDGTYTITKNGNYEFIAVDSQNNTKNKIITISSIDKIPPKDFSLNISNTTSAGFTIMANAEDGDETVENSKSGIARYEYYINDVKYESESNTYDIDNLEPGTEYTVYVIAYDKAGNSKTAESITTKTEYLVKTYLYQNGNEYQDITGGWDSLTQSNAVCTKTEEYVYMKSNSNMSATQTLTTARKIDITDYKKLIIKANCISFKTSSRPGRFGIYDSVPVEVVFSDVSVYGQFLANSVTQEYELDISQLQGEKAIIIYGQPELYIYEIYLTK